MTEPEWLASRDPERMVLGVAPAALRAGWPDAPRTARKRALFGAACCRLVWPLVAADERCRRLVEHLERQFDEPASDEEAEELAWGAKMAAEHPDDGTPLPQQLAANLVYGAGIPATDIAWVVRGLSDWGDPQERAVRVADVLRCVVGNPFRPAAFDPAQRTPTVVALARPMSDGRAFDRMPVLADALEEAGSEDADVLGHCRQPGEHVRGCWVVDAVSGRA